MVKGVDVGGECYKLNLYADNLMLYLTEIDKYPSLNRNCLEILKYQYLATKWMWKMSIHGCLPNSEELIGFKSKTEY